MMSEAQDQPLAVGNADRVVEGLGVNRQDQPVLSSVPGVRNHSPGEYHRRVQINRIFQDLDARKHERAHDHFLLKRFFS